MSFEEILIDRRCFECKEIIPAREVFRETVYKNDMRLCRYFHKDCAKKYCDRQKLEKVE